MALSRKVLEGLVMDYLVVEGYRDAAAAFAAAGGPQPTADLNSVQGRMQIRTAMHAGEIDVAVDLVNDLKGTLLDDNPRLVFRLRLQQLIERVRTGDALAALAFAREEVAPLTNGTPELVAEMEEVLALLVFPDPTVSPLSHLLEPARRQQTASGLNSAILAAQNQNEGARLAGLLHLYAWSEEAIKGKSSEEALDLDTLASSAFRPPPAASTTV